MGGAAIGIMRASPVGIFAAVTGVQWFCLASSYIGSRELLIHAWNGEENLSKTEKVMASGVAGGVAGMSGALLRSRSNILPGMLVFSVLGAGSTLIAQQMGPSAADLERERLRRPSAETFAQQEAAKKRGGILDWKYSPMTRLSDRDYEKRLEERLLRVDAEIAIIDDTIKSLKMGETQAQRQARDAAEVFAAERREKEKEEKK